MRKNRLKLRLFVYLFIGLLSLYSISATVIVSPRNPTINGNNWVFVHFNSSEYVNSTIGVTFFDINNVTIKSCNITTNYLGYGISKCKYIFNYTDLSGTWYYNITNTTESGTFNVSKISLNMVDVNSLTSIKYGRKTDFNLTFSYDGKIPREITRQTISRDLGTGSTYNYYLDVDGDGGKEIVWTDAAGVVWIWDNITRIKDGVQTIAGTDWKSVDIGALYNNQGPRFYDFNSNSRQTMIIPDNNGFIRAFIDINISQGQAVNYNWSTTPDFGSIRGGVAICDIDGDGMADQIGAGTYEGVFYLWNYTDVVGFTQVYNSSIWVAMAQDLYPLCDDFDGDGLNEWMMGTSLGPRFIDINHNTGGTFNFYVNGTDRGTYYQGINVDFEGDGKSAAIFPISTGFMQTVEFNVSGTKLLEEKYVWMTDNSTENKSDIYDFALGSSEPVINDLDRNGIPDFVITGGTDRPPVYFYIWNLTANNTITRTSIFPYIFEQSNQKTEYVDFDGDGFDEVMVFGRYSGNVYILKYNGITWDLVHRGWMQGNEDYFSGDGVLYSGTPLTGWAYSNCIADDLDADGREEALCTPYDGNIFLYEEQHEYTEFNVTPMITFIAEVNDGIVEDINSKYTEVRLKATGTNLFIGQNIALGITNISDQDGQNQGSIADIWTDGKVSTQEYQVLQNTWDYATLDASQVENATWSRIRFPENYTVGKITVWNYHNDGRSFDNVIVATSTNATSAACDWYGETRVYDNSLDGTNQKYSESSAGKSIYFEPIQNVRCVRESTSGSDYLTTVNNTANFRTEIQIYETETYGILTASVNRRTDSALAVKDNWVVTLNAHDRTSNLINITTTYSLPVTYNTLPFYMSYVGGTEYYSSQVGQTMVQLKDEFNDPVTGATCNTTVYYPNMTQWSVFGLAEIGSGVYYSNFTVPFAEGVYLSILNCTAGDFTDTDAHTFHVTNLIINLNTSISYVNTNLNLINTSLSSNLISVNTTITYVQSLVQYINETTTDINEMVNVINTTTSDSYMRINELYLRENCTDYIAEVGTKCWYLDKINQSFSTINVSTGSGSGASAADVWAYGDSLSILQSIRNNQTTYFPKWNTMFSYWNGTYFVNWNGSIGNLNYNFTQLWEYWNCAGSNNQVCNYLIQINQSTSGFNQTISNIRTSQLANFRMELSHFDSITAGSKYKVKLYVFDFEGTPMNLTSTPVMNIFDSLLTQMVTNKDMIIDYTGVYSAYYNTTASATSGVWETIVSVDKSGDIIYLNDYWSIASSPADVTIVNMSDVTVQSISANVQITNMGTQGSDFEYVYCIVTSSENLCGGGDDTDYQSGTIFINPGFTWDGNLGLEVLTPGQYYFKVKAKALAEVNWAGASKQFTAVADTGSAGGATGGAIHSDTLDGTTYYECVSNATSPLGYYCRDYSLYRLRCASGYVLSQEGHTCVKEKNPNTIIILFIVALILIVLYYENKNKSKRTAITVNRNN